MPPLPLPRLAALAAILTAVLAACGGTSEDAPAIEARRDATATSAPAPVGPTTAPPAPAATTTVEPVATTAPTPTAKPPTDEERALAIAAGFPCQGSVIYARNTAKCNLGPGSGGHGEFATVFVGKPDRIDEIIKQQSWQCEPERVDGGVVPSRWAKAWGTDWWVSVTIASSDIILPLLPSDQRVLCYTP